MYKSEAAELSEARCISVWRKMKKLTTFWAVSFFILVGDRFLCIKIKAGVRGKDLLLLSGC